MKVFLAGEGVGELGDWFHHPSYRVGNDAPGIIESLLFKLGLQPEVVGALKWTDIPKFKAGGRLQAEARNVLGAALDAQLAGADALIFVRDRDNKQAREDDIEQGLREAGSKFHVKVAGGVAAQEIEAWILALRGELRSESHHDATGVLKERHGIDTRAAMVAAIASANLDAKAEDSHSLDLWIDRVTKALS